MGMGMGMKYHFLHAADLHLDSPLIGLGAKSPELAQRVADASRLAFDNLINLAIERGCRVALAALVDRTCAELAGQTHSTPRLYCTGGAVDEVLPYILTTYERVPDLVLRGLARIVDVAL